MSEDQPLRIEPVWHPDWNDDTATLAYEASLGTREKLTEWADALDTKLLGVLAIGGVILTISPVLQPPAKHPAVVGLWIVAMVAWFVAMAFGVHGYRPTTLRVGPNPIEFLDPVWLGKSPRDFRLWQIAEIADTFRRNHATLKEKAEALKWALGFTVVEVLALAGAFVLSCLNG